MSWVAVGLCGFGWTGVVCANAGAAVSANATAPIIIVRFMK
jgi:hypothetical protein